MKKLYIITIAIIVLTAGIFLNILFNKRGNDGGIIYPLADMRSNKSKWVVSITKVDSEMKSLVIADSDILYANKNSFKIEMLEDAYITTPAYIVRIIKNGKEIQKYPLLSLEQIEFGNIPRSGYGTILCYPQPEEDPLK